MFFEYYQLSVKRLMWMLQNSCLVHFFTKILNHYNSLERIGRNIGVGACAQIINKHLDAHFGKTLILGYFYFYLLLHHFLRWKGSLEQNKLIASGISLSLSCKLVLWFNISLMLLILPMFSTISTWFLLQFGFTNYDHQMSDSTMEFISSAPVEALKLKLEN